MIGVYSLLGAKPSEFVETFASLKAGGDVCLNDWEAG